MTHILSKQKKNGYKKLQWAKLRRTKNLVFFQWSSLNLTTPLHRTPDTTSGGVRHERIKKEIKYIGRISRGGEGIQQNMSRRPYPQNKWNRVPKFREEEFRVKIGYDRKQEPQGAVLSPQLYHIYTAHILKPDYPMDSTIIALYADDTASVIAVSNRQWYWTGWQSCL